MIRLEGDIIDADARYMTVRVPYNPEYVRQDMKKAIVFLEDGRQLSHDQRKKAWALVGEIAKWAGYMPREHTQVNADLKREFLLRGVEHLTAQAIQSISLSDTDMSTASLYIQFLVDYVIENGVPTDVPVTDLCEDVQKAVYSAAIHKKCIVCGKRADLHHVDRVGMGGNRKEICHIGMRALPLCREHHNEAHQHGDVALMDKYHLEPIVIDEKIAKVHRLKKTEDK